MLPRPPSITSKLQYNALIDLSDRIVVHTILEKSYRTAGEKFELWQIKIDKIHIMIRFSTWYVPTRHQLQARFS